MAALVAVGAPSAALAWTKDTFSGSSENEMITLINQARAAAGLPALVELQSLTSVARWRSKDMNDRDYFCHSIPPDGATIPKDCSASPASWPKVFAELHRRDICYTLAGENIGVNNYPDNVATQTMFNGWMNSPGHRALILGAGFNRIGLGAFKGTDGSYPNHYWTAVFTHTCSGSDPDPTPKPKPKPTPKPAPKATPKPTPGPAIDPADPTSEPAPRVSADAVPAGSPDSSPSPGSSGQPDPASLPDPGGVVTDPEGGSLQVLDPPPSMGLLDAIVGGVVASYLGH